MTILCLIFGVGVIVAAVAFAWSLIVAEGLQDMLNPPVILGPCRDERHEWEA